MVWRNIVFKYSELAKVLAHAPIPHMIWKPGWWAWGKLICCKYILPQRNPKMNCMFLRAHRAHWPTAKSHLFILQNAIAKVVYCFSWTKSLVEVFNTAVDVYCILVYGSKWFTSAAITVIAAKGRMQCTPRHQQPEGYGSPWLLQECLEDRGLASVENVMLAKVLSFVKWAWHPKQLRGSPCHHFHEFPKPCNSTYWGCAGPSVESSTEACQIWNSCISLPWCKCHDSPVLVQL